MCARLSVLSPDGGDVLALGGIDPGLKDATLGLFFEGPDDPCSLRIRTLPLAGKGWVYVV